MQITTYRNEALGGEFNHYRATMTALQAQATKINCGDKVTIIGEFVDEEPLIAVNLSWENWDAMEANERPIGILMTEDGMMVRRDSFCRCDENPENWIQYRDLMTGAHGWACKDCRRVTQTG